MWQNIVADPTNKKYIHTLREIQQQPECWKKTAEMVLENKELASFFSMAIQDTHRPIIVSGAGSSEFVGKSLLDILSKLTNRRVLNAPTTDIVTHPEKYNIPTEPSLMISFARSGNSPESVAAVKLIKKTCPTTKHLIVTCNDKGALAQINDSNTFCLTLPEETNDQSLVMTSSFSSMLLATILCGLTSKKQETYQKIEQLNNITTGIFSNQAEKIGKLIENSNISRIQFLGSSDAVGLLTESHLKMLEMTDGHVATRVDSFLGLRHGPQVFVNKDTIVVAVLSSDSYVRQYELDMLKELKQKQQGCAYIIVGHNPQEVEMLNMIVCDTKALDDFLVLFPAIVMSQLLGFFESLHLGLSPDAPSTSGTINRVVQGVTIYEYN